jgi:hypothetical protein
MASSSPIGLQFVLTARKQVYPPEQQKQCTKNICAQIYFRNRPHPGASRARRLSPTRTVHNFELHSQIARNSTPPSLKQFGTIMSHPAQELRRPPNVARPVQPPVPTRGSTLRRLSIPSRRIWSRPRHRPGPFSRISADPGLDQKPQNLGKVTIFSKSRPVVRGGMQQKRARPETWRLEKVSWPFVLRADCLIPTCGGEETEVGTFLFGFVPRTHVLPRYSAPNKDVPFLWSDVMPGNPKECRKHALFCTCLAATAWTAQSKSLFLELSQNW